MQVGYIFCIFYIYTWGVCISKRAYTLLGFLTPHPLTQSSSHNLITDTSDTRDTQLFKSPSNFKRDFSKQPFRGLFSVGWGSPGLLWMDWFGANVVRGNLYCDNSSVNTVLHPQLADPQWARHLSQRKSLENLTLKREVLHNTLLIPHPRPTLSKKDWKNTQPEHATLATLLGSVEGIIRMNYPSPSCDLKIAEHTKSYPRVNGWLLFACIKMRIAAVFCDIHFMSV